MRTTIELPPDLLRAIDVEKIALPKLIVRLLRRHLRQISEKPVKEIHLDEPLDWRQELL
jgi:hypothetical protein